MGSVLSLVDIVISSTHVACLVLLGMICITISPLSHLCMYVYCNNVFDNTV